MPSLHVITFLVGKSRTGGLQDAPRCSKRLIRRPKKPRRGPQDAPKTLPRPPKTSPRRFQDASMTAPKRLQDGLASQDVPKTPPRRPKTLPRRPQGKTPLRRPKMPRRGPERRPKSPRRSPPRNQKPSRFIYHDHTKKRENHLRQNQRKLKRNIISNSLFGTHDKSSRR